MFICCEKNIYWIIINVWNITFSKHVWFMLFHKCSAFHWRCLVHAMVDVQLFHSHPFVSSFGNCLSPRSTMDSKFDSECFIESKKKWSQTPQHWWLEHWTRSCLCNNWFIFSWQVHRNIVDFTALRNIWICSGVARPMVAGSTCKHVGIHNRNSCWEILQVKSL